MTRSSTVAERPLNTTCHKHFAKSLKVKNFNKAKADIVRSKLKLERKLTENIQWRGHGGGYPHCPPGPLIADRRATVSTAAFVCHQLCADHITHRRVQFPNGVQDSTSATFAQEARTRQGADVQLPADIQPDNHLEGDRTAGTRQAVATPALISELLTTAVSVPARALH